MAEYMGNDASVTINSVDLSDHVAQISFTETSAELESTAMGDSNVTRIGGLKDGSVTIEFHADFAASEVYATINPLLGTTTTVLVQPVSGSVSATNPSKSVSALVTDVPFVDHAVGDLATVSVTWPFSGAVTTATA
ncbi:MAG: radical SAM protein [Euryarchaeota archaeon]|nr:radical SAM protein [Euryarchaeota archaeon]